VQLGMFVGGTEKGDTGEDVERKRAGSKRMFLEDAGVGRGSKREAGD